MDAKNGLSDMLTILNNLYDAALKILAYTAGLTVILIMFAISYGVIARKFFATPIPWVIEISSYALLYITFLGAPWILRNNGHVRVDLLYSVLGRRNKNILSLAASVLGAVTSFILLAYGLTVTIDNWERNIMVMNTLAVPKIYFAGGYPAGQPFFADRISQAGLRERQSLAA